MEKLLPHELNEIERKLKFAEVNDESVVVSCRDLRAMLYGYGWWVKGSNERSEELEIQIQMLRDERDNANDRVRELERELDKTETPHSEPLPASLAKSIERLRR